MPLYTVGIIFQYFYQACGRYKFASWLAVAANIVFVVPIVLLLMSHFGLKSLWLSFPLNNAAFLLMIFCITCYHCRRIPLRLEDYLMLSKDFYVPEDKQLNITVVSKSEVIKLSEHTQNFATRTVLTNESACSRACALRRWLAISSITALTTGKKHFVDICVIIKEDEVVIRMRDDCRHFDPKKQDEMYNPEDPRRTLE